MVEQQQEDERSIPTKQRKKKKPFLVRKIQAMETLQWLGKQFPQAFCLKKPRPLKINIHHDVFEQLLVFKNAPSKKKIREAITFYTRTNDYLFSVTKNQQRVDLAGRLVGKITEEQVEFAAIALQQRKSFCSR